jgi:glycosyltransferase involved in cell wall biosynthesis
MHPAEVGASRQTPVPSTQAPRDPTGAPPAREARPREGPRGRVLSICRIFWNGGVQRVAIGEVDGLRAEGWTCDLVFLRRTPGAGFALPSGTRVLRTSGSMGPRAFGGLFHAVTSRYAGHRGPEATVDLDLMIESLPLSGEYDVTVYNDQYTALMGILNRVRHRRPYVMILHEFYPKVHVTLRKRLFLYPFADLYDAIALLMAPAVVATSRKNFSRLQGIVRDKSYLARIGAPAPNPVAISSRDRYSVCSISIWDSGRHPEVYLQVARLAPEFRFVIAGTWPDPGFQQRIAREAADLPNVRITGEISESERERLMADSLLYLRVGYNETGPGMGGLEALARGAIVIANRGLGISEIIRDGVDGFVTEQGDPPSIVRVLRRIGELSQERLLELSDASLALAAKYSWGEHARVLGQALDKALGRETS